MKTVLIVLLGNRDLQIPSTASMPMNFTSRLEKNNDDNNYFIIGKRNNQESFLDTSKQIWDNYSTFQDVIHFPMIEETLRQVGKVDEVILTTSKQEPLDNQDCYYISKIAEKYFSDNYNTKSVNFSCNPTNFTCLLNFFTELTDSYRNHKIYFGNSGGTADMKAASYFAGVFKDVEYITINARTRAASQNNFKKQEQTILKHIIEKMLDNFDYGGVSQLPIQNKEVILLSKYALSRIALDYDSSSEIAEKINDEKLYISSNTSLKEKERDLAISAKIKLKQNSYGDFLWRLFTIYDNIYLPYLNDFFNAHIEDLYEPKNQHSEWNSLIQSYPSILNYLENKTYKNGKLDWSSPNKKAHEAIMKFLIKEDLISDPPYLNDLVKSFHNLSPLRNSIAHRYEGISLKLIEDELIKKITPTIEDFNLLLSNYIGLEKDDFQIYDYINEKIKSLL